MTHIDRIDNFIRGLGVEAYRVGGSVRDEILGRRAKDADYMVRGVSLTALGKFLRDDLAHVDGGTVSKLSLRDGRQAGWRVSARGMGLVEIVLPRREVSTGPGHRDFEIQVDPWVTLEEDALRRDFTFNALYKRVKDGEVIDPTGRGLHDLQRGMISTTHPDSFRDDPLRTLRALRFVARGFTLTTYTTAEMLEHAAAVDGLTANGYASGTVIEEMTKILMGDNVREALRIARDTGVLGALFPELVPMLGFDQGSKYHDMTTDEHTFAALDFAAKVDAPERVRWALLFHDAGKPFVAWVGADGRKHYYARSAEGGPYDSLNMDHEEYGELLWRQAAARLGATKSLREDVSVLIRNHMVSLEGNFKASKVRRGRVKFGDAMLRDLYLHRACDVAGKGKPNKEHIERIMRMETERAAAQGAGVPSKVTDLAINGNTLMAMGIHGREIGRVLNALLLEVASQPNETTMDPDWQMQRACALAEESCAV